MFEVYFDDTSPPIRCQSVSEVDSTLDELATSCDRPILVDIRIPGYLVQIGLGLDPTFVFISTGHENDGDYVVTVGDENSIGVVDVFGCGVHTQIDRSHLVSYASARKAVRQFIEDGGRLASLRWQDCTGREV